MKEQIALTKGKFADKLNKDQMDSVRAQVDKYVLSFDKYKKLADQKQLVQDAMRVAAADALQVLEAIRSEQRRSLLRNAKSRWRLSKKSC